MKKPLPTCRQLIIIYLVSNFRQNLLFQCVEEDLLSRDRQLYTINTQKYSNAVL